MHREHKNLIDAYCLKNLCNLIGIYYKILVVLKAFKAQIHALFLAKRIYHLIKKKVRFDLQLYTGRGSTIKFEN